MRTANVNVILCIWRGAAERAVPAAGDVALAIPEDRRATRGAYVPSRAAVSGLVLDIASVMKRRVQQLDRIGSEEWVSPSMPLVFLV